MKRNHMFWMIIGCTVPLLLIFLAPAFGLGGNSSLLLFVIAMFTVHLLMPHGHGGHSHNSSPSKKTQNESHQH
jgi:hypothetical protein